MSDVTSVAICREGFSPFNQVYRYFAMKTTLIKMHFWNILILNDFPGKGEVGRVVNIILKHSGGFKDAFLSAGKVQLCSYIFSCCTESYNLSSLDASPFSTSLTLKMACLLFILPFDSTSLKFRKDWVAGVANTVIT